MRYAVAKLPTPVFNTPHSPFASRPLVLDGQGRIMALETIAFPGAKFVVEEVLRCDMLRVTTTEYTSEKPLYVDSRFLQAAEASTPERTLALPSLEEICGKMKQLLGIRYFWGGTWPSGIPEMLDFYPHHSEKDANALCRGIDCSGLLYYATGGLTPRNTSALMHFGANLEIENLSSEEVQKGVKSLDLFVWPGHVVIALDPETMIESRLGHGVYLSPFCDRLEEARKMTKAQGKPLVCRRWAPCPAETAQS